MNILLISECDKRALVQTRRILDQFAERRGERTWQTPITRDGLDTLRKMLRQSARKNTAVACHWVRGLDHSELLWVVGDRSRFNAQGAVPTNTTTRNILRTAHENDWHTGQDIHLLTALAALLHDLGKASQAFQMRLRGELSTADGHPERNQYRHEWVSLRLFEAFVGQDDDANWLARLANPTEADHATWQSRLQRDGLDATVQPPFANLAHAPLAQAVGWLVLTHHRLPVAPSKDAGFPTPPLGRKVHWVSHASLHGTLAQIDAGWNERTDGGDPNHHLPLYWQFPHGLPVTTEAWRKRAARLAQRLLVFQTQPNKGQWLANPYVMHVARLSLMLADHHYSSLGMDGHGKPVAGRVQGQAGYPLFANTHPSVPAAHNPHRFNQPLDEHLLGVAAHSSEVTHALPRFDTHLPRLADCKHLKKRSPDPRFRWQDKAFDLAAGVRARTQQHGAFVVNMASTGCGKTLANARIMYALADPAQGMRCAFAMGLRTLTLQTGRAFGELLGLADDELAIRVGGSASRALFGHQERLAEQTGSASRQALLDEDTHIVWEGNADGHPLLQRVMHDPQVRQLLAAPLLVCTIDHLTPATESQRGGHQIAPMLRLMSGDLVLDEPDDFDITDLPALTRLVHWAGLLGARVLLSSATLPPALVQGLFQAYAQGRQHFANNRGSTPGAVPNVCCLWVDEAHQQHTDCATPAQFEAAHLAFAQRRISHLAQVAATDARRRGKFIALDPKGAMAKARPADMPFHFATVALTAALKLHSAHHSVCPHSGKRISFGLIRMANIEPLVGVALALYQQTMPDGFQVHLCTYHSQYPLLLRSAMERQLDQALNRRQAEAVFKLPDIRQRMDGHSAADQLFIVLGSPVTEVGRDHDYDWAVVEPSSMRSLIQLAGRVRRHRPASASTEPNVRVLDTNVRDIQHNGTRPAYCKPGFETEAKAFRLTQRGLANLLLPEQYQVIDARARTLEARAPKPHSNLVDLEHARLRATMLPAGELNAASWWHLPATDALLTAVLPQQQPFRDDPIPRVDVLLRPNEDGDDFELVELLAHRQAQQRQRGEAEPVVVERSKNHRIQESQVHGHGIQPWGHTNYMTALSELAAEMDITPMRCAEKFGTVTLPQHEAGWRFHPALGFSRWRG